MQPSVLSQALCQWAQESPGLDVIKPEYSLRLKIKRNDWLLANTCLQAANRCVLFWVWEWTQILLPRGLVLKDVSIVDVNSTESDAHFIGYFTGFNIEMLWYLVLPYWVGLYIIAKYEILWKIDKSKSNTIWATMWENDSLRKKFHYHRNTIVWFYRVMLYKFLIVFIWLDYSNFEVRYGIFIKGLYTHSMILPWKMLPKLCSILTC